METAASRHAAPVCHDDDDGDDDVLHNRMAGMLGVCVCVCHCLTPSDLETSEL